jgi:transcriptional regulator with XRE-family HTH domain
MIHLEEAVRRALAEAPGSVREIAREAGVDHSTLVRIRRGDRGATRDVARALADALGRWAGRCSSAEGILRQSLSQEVEDE